MFRRSWLAAVPPVVVVVVALGAPVPKVGKTTQADLLIGMWNLVETKHGPQLLGAATFEFKADGTLIIRRSCPIRNYDDLYGSYRFLDGGLEVSVPINDNGDGNERPMLWFITKLTSSELVIDAREDNIRSEFVFSR